MQVKLSFLTKIMLLVFLLMTGILAVISALLINQSSAAIDSQHREIQQQNARRYELLNSLLTERILLWSETFTTNPDGMPASEAALTQAIESARSTMDVNLQISNVWLFSGSGDLIYGDASALPGFVNGLRVEAQQQWRPQAVTSCAHLCRRYIVAPIMTEGDQPAVLVFTSGMQELLALLSKSAGVERIAIARGSDNAASMEVISRLSASNKEAVSNILKALPADVSIGSLIEQGHRVRLGERRLLISLLPVVDGRLPDSYILFARDITTQVASARNYQEWVMGSAFLVVVVFAFVVFLILNQYRYRLTTLSKRLPLLAENRYKEFKKGISASHAGTKRWPDELDVLEYTATNVAFELETLDSKMALTNAQLENMAMFDSLTGLPNRNMLTFHMAKEISRMGRSQKGLGLLFIDLDDFKRINDSHGHDVGDKLIAAAAHRIREPLRDEDIAARFGGDEFVILLTGLESEEQATVVARKLIHVFEAPIQFDEHQFYVSLSIGIAYSVLSDITVVELQRHADIAMYEAKAQKGSAYCVFDSTMHQKVMRRVELEAAARIGLSQDQFSLALQPQLELATGKLVGFEALIRWHHPEKGFISPGEFIPLLENTSLMSSIDYWVISHSLSWLSHLRRQGLTDVKIAINVSASQFLDPALPDYVKQQLLEHDIPPCLVELELTETALVEDVTSTSNMLDTLRQIGCIIAIDDFGTGYSSLGYLKALPADFIKIDRSFVSGMLDNQDDRSIVSSTIAMVRGMGLTVIAEGIETHEQFALLKEFGCQQGQGYLFSPPIPEDKLWEALSQHLDDGVWKVAPLA